MKRFFSIALIIGAVASLALSQQPAAISTPASRRESSPEIRRKTFEKVWETARDKFFDPTMSGVDWQKVRENYAPRVAAVKSDAELYALMLEMLELLRVSHFDIIEPETLEQLKQKPVIVGMALKLIEGRVVIWRVWPNSSVSESPLRTGYAITSIDGVAVDSVESSRKLMAGTAGTTLRVGYLDDKDEAKEVTLQRRFLSMEDIEKQDFGGGIASYSIFISKRVSDGIGYIHFSSFIAPLEKKVRVAIESMHDAPGLIIDLRENGGGDDSLGIALAGMLFDKKTQLMITRTRKGDDFYYKAKPQKNAFTGPVVILLDDKSASASEQFAAGLQEVGRAFVIGIKTPGDDMDADIRELPSGALLVFPYGQPRTPKGVIIDGRGVIPNLEVKLSRKDLLAGDDTQLSAAIEWIRKQNTKGNH